MSQEKHIDVESEFGIDVFDDTEMRRHLPKKVYEELSKTIREGKDLDASLADDVAHGLKEWALSKGATHYTHWFQPLNGLTAEKHDSFLSRPDSQGKVLMEFSGKELIKGEPDASSFPSGGLRATFEARGYTAWDCTSPAFVIHDDYGAVLYIPTAFCSYTDEALDEKTPLLRSMDYLSDQAIRVLRLFGDRTARRVIPYAGAEQEYFLIDSDRLARRKDLVYTGRTLFGSPAPKGQELEDHYFGPIREKISAFMAEVNEVLWRLGIAAKTQHNEVAPSQHELAIIYAPSNVAADQNQLVMIVLKRIAKKHGLICLLAEKPFEGINGSGKHNNWSLGTDDGTELLKPGDKPEENWQFLAFFTAIIKACDEYAGLLRESTASYSNDFRLGGNEAPPAILSVFIGDELQEIVEDILRDEKKKNNGKNVLKTGVKTLPMLYKDTTDRNRTSPFAFTGNKFEFRMVGSESNISEANTVINTIVGTALKDLADFADGKKDAEKAIREWIRDNLEKHQRVIFNGDGYSKEWAQEAKRRGLPDLKTAVDAIPVLTDKKVVDLFVESHVLTKNELLSRAEIKYTSYASQALIDCRTMSHMAHKILLPSANRYLAFLYGEKKDAGKVPQYVEETIAAIEKDIDLAYDALVKLDKDVEKFKTLKGRRLAEYVRDVLLADMQALREPIDRLELLVDKSYWPIPSYGDLLFHTI